VLVRGASMFLGHGAGTWLMDSKAQAGIAAAPGKNTQCVFDNDLQLCVLETGSDTLSPRTACSRRCGPPCKTSSV